MKFDEWWGTYNAKVTYSVGGVSNTHHREECEAIAHGAWKQGFDEGKKHVSLIRGADTEACKDEPTHTESETMGPLWIKTVDKVYANTSCVETNQAALENAMNLADMVCERYKEWT